MDSTDDQTHLEETVYKPTVQEANPVALKANSQKKTSSFLYFAAGTANLIAFSTGICLGWPSPFFPKLAKLEDNPLGRTLTPTEGSWIASLPAIGIVIGPLICGVLSDRIGRKKTLLLFSLLITVSCILSAFATTVSLFYISRLIVGIGAASCFSVLPLYLAEVSEDHNRGTICCSMGVSICLGLLFVFVVGPFTSIQNFGLLSSSFTIIFFVVFALWIPETPHFLAGAKQTKELEKSLTKLRSKSITAIEKEMQEIIRVVSEEKENQGGVSDLFKFRGLRKGLIITVGLLILQQFAGINAVLCYLETIFIEAGGGLSPVTSTIIIATIQLLTCIATSLLADRLGRRILFLVSALFSCFALLALGLYFYLKANNYDITSFTWLPVSSLIVYIIAFNIGLGPLPWAIMAELFPSNVKSAASILCTVICFFCAFLITFYFRQISLVLGMANSFWIFAVVCLGGFVFIYFILPETKGKSLQEIQKILEGTK